MSTQPERARGDDAAGSGAHGGTARFARRMTWLRGPLLLIAALVYFFSTPLARYDEVYYSTVDFLQDYALPRVVDGHEPGNRLIGDPVVEMQPWLAFNRAQLRAGHVPLWNPYNAGGVPHLANYQSAVFSPFSAPFYFLSFKAALIVSAFLKLFGLGLFTFLFLRELGLRMGGALVGAFAFMFSGHNVLLLAYPHVGAELALPAGLYFVERIFKRHATASRTGVRTSTDRRALLWSHVGVTLSLLVGLLAGQPEPFYFGLLVVCAYCVFRLLQLALGGLVLPAVARVAGGLMLAGALAAGLAAFQLLPFFEYLQASHVLEQRSSVQTPLSNLILPLMLFPDLLGNPSGPFNFSLRIPPPNYETANMAYIGSLVLFLVLVSACFARRDRRIAFFGTIAGLWVLYAYDIFGLGKLFALVPGLAIAPINRSQAAWQFCLACCAALAIDHCRTRELRARWVPAALTSIAGGVFIYVGRERAFALVERTLKYFNYLKPPVAEFNAHAQLHVAEFCTLFAIGLLGCIGLWLARALFLRTLAAALVLLAVCCQSGFHLKDYNSVSENRFFFPATPALVELRARVGGANVVLVGDDALPPMTNMPYELSLIQSYDALWVRRYDALFRDVFGQRGNLREINRGTQAGLKLFGVDYVLHRGDWVDIDTGFAGLPVNPLALRKLDPILPSTPVTQTFQARRDGLQALKLVFTTFARRNDCTLSVRLEEAHSGKLVLQRKLSCADVVEGEDGLRPLIFRFGPLADSRDKLYRITLASEDARAGNALTAIARTDFGHWESIAALGDPRNAPDEVLALRERTRSPFEKGSLQQGATVQTDGLYFDYSYGQGEFEELCELLDFKLARYRASLSKYYTVNDAIPAASDTQAFALVSDPSFDPARAVVLRREDVAQARSPSPSPSTGETPAQERVIVQSEQPTSIRLNVHRTTSGYLVLTKPWYPGWKARVNGRDQPLLQANYAFNALPLEPGTSRVEFYYEPESFAHGLWISASCLLAGGALVAWNWLAVRKMLRQGNPAAA